MAGFDGGDDFSDDVLDNLGSDDFQELEQHAFAATQAEQPLPENRQYGLYELPQAPERGALLAKSRTLQGDELLLDETFPPSLQSTLGDAETLQPIRQTVNNIGAADTERLPGESTQQEQWRQQRYTQPYNPQGSQGSNHNDGASNLALPHRAAKPEQARIALHYPPAKPGIQRNRAHEDESDALWKIKQELEQARLNNQRLEGAIKAANDQVNAKNGEISIIRSNQAKVQREHERRVEEIRQQQQRDNERHRTEIENAQKEKDKLAVHNRFLDHEINDQSWQLKQAQRSKKSFTRQAGDQTPKKLVAAPLRDGFDDDEIMVVSPSKSGGKGKPSTPRAGTKRKRDVIATTPTPSLQLDNDGDSVLPDAQQPAPAKPESKATAEHASHDKERLEFLQDFLNHRMSKGDKRTLETLCQFSLPSQRAKGNTLSSELMDRMAPLSYKPEIEDFPGAVGSVIISIWSQCLYEKYYEPVRVLMDLVMFILLNTPRSSAVYMISDLVVVTQGTADVNILPRYRRKRKATTTSTALTSTGTATKDAPLPEDDTSPHIDTQACLQLLDLAATLLRREPGALGTFWQAMRFDFISMVLRPFQDAADVLVLARLLATSVRADGFAMVVPPDASQAKSEAHVTDRMTAMLIEVPRPSPESGELEVDAALVAEMRLQLLELVEAMCGRRYCAAALARHPLALGRLARTLHDELAALYDYRHGHELRVELVNRATRLLFHLTTKYGDEIGDLQAKLRATTPTSVYKYLIGLSRLAFSDGVFLERGIEEDVIDCAHQMLEVLVTPEEAEELQRAFVKDV